MVVFPVAIAVTCPWLPEVLLTVAVTGEDELHVALAETFWVVPSLIVAVALSWAVVPDGIDKFTGVMAIDLRLGKIVSVAVSEILEMDPVIVALPVDTPEASPKAEIVATVGTDEDQVVEEETSFWDPSE
jgi:hypothetical protein